MHVVAHPGGEVECRWVPSPPSVDAQVRRAVPTDVGIGGQDMVAFGQLGARHVPIVEHAVHDHTAHAAAGHQLDAQRLAPDAA